MGRALQRIAIIRIAELTNTRIEAESVDFNFDGSVFIKKLVIRSGGEQKYDEGSRFAKEKENRALDAILRAETVYVRFGIGGLLRLRPQLKEVSVDDFVFNAQHDLDTGRWNLSTLKIKAPKGGSGKMPVVRLERGTLQYSEVSNGRTEVAAAVPIDARFRPAEKMLGGYSFNITTGQSADAGKSTLVGFWQPGKIVIAGRISSTNIPVFERAWTINVLDAELDYDQGNTYLLKLKIKDLLCTRSSTPDTFAISKSAFWEKFSSYTALQRFFSRYRPAGQVDIDLEASGNLGRISESKLVGKVHCKDVSICDLRFPYSLEHIVGRIDFTENSAVLNNLYGEHGNVKVALNGWSKDFGPNRQYQIRITSDNMALDNDLYNALSTKYKKLWSDFSPGGLTAIDYHTEKQPQTDKKRTLAVKLLDAEATYIRFPYPLKNLTGTLLFEHDGTTISDVVSQLNERKITLNGKVITLGTDQPTYDISVKANNIPLDSTLAAALSANQKRSYNRIDTAGLICIGYLTGRIWSEEESKQPYYRLLLHTERTELNDALFSLLPAPLEKITSEFQPTGKVNISADLSKAGSGDYPDYKITVDCLGNSANFERFPYPLKDITGSLTITKDSIKLEDITATAADSVQITPNIPTIKIDGQITLADNAFSSGWFQLSANDIFLDERLGFALPEDIQDIYFKLSPTGRFDLDLENVKIFAADGGEKCIDFAGTAKFKACGFNASLSLTELDAVLETKGLYKTGEGLRDGQAALFADSLKIKGKSLTSLKADIYYDSSRRNWLTKNLVADCYDGRLTGKFELKQPAEAASRYLLQVGFDNIDLKQFLWDRERDEVSLATPSNTEPEETSHSGYTSGKMAGSLSVSAAVDGSSPRIGRCRLAITDMQVGKLSPLAKLLQVLKLTEPKDFAFDRMLVDSYIKHNRLFFQQLDLSGEAVAFNGSGWMNLQDQNVDLILTARGRRLAGAEPSLLQSLTEGLGQGVVRMEVSGNFYDPQVTTMTLPVIKDTLQILGTKPTTPDQSRR